MRRIGVVAWIVVGAIGCRTGAPRAPSGPPASSPKHESADEASIASLSSRFDRHASSPNAVDSACLRLRLTGQAMAPILEACYGGTLDDETAQDRMRTVMARLTQGRSGLAEEVRTYLLDWPAPNAFSLPGLIYITRGLYDRLSDDDSLAAAVAHELAHILRADHFKPACRTPEEALRREILADAHARSMLREAGYDPDALITIIEWVRQVQPEGWPEARIQALRQSTREPMAEERRRLGFPTIQSP